MIFGSIFHGEKLDFVHGLTHLCALQLRSLPPKIFIGSTSLPIEEIHGHPIASYDHPMSFFVDR